MDLTKAAVVSGGVALAIALLAAGYIAWENLGSRNLGLATATLAAAAILFVIQVAFELQGSKEYDHIAFEYTLDRSVPTIRRAAYSAPQLPQLLAETDAAEWIAGNNPQALQENDRKVFSDLAIVSLVAFLGAEQFDWQLRTVLYKGTSIPGMYTIQGVSPPNQCTTITSADLQKQLEESGNLFAPAHLNVLFRGQLCLPPQSSLAVTSESVILRNPVSEVRFSLDKGSAAISHRRPRSRLAEAPMVNGRPQYDTRTDGFAVEVTYFALRSQTRNIASYRNWVTRVLSGAHQWFEGATP